eukprot:13111177-Alexandrium_andersonii.AAC.1
MPQFCTSTPRILKPLARSTPPTSELNAQRWASVRTSINCLMLSSVFAIRGVGALDLSLIHI